MSKVKVERLGELECQCFVGNYAINVMYFERDSSPMAIPSKRLCVENARMTREALKWTNLIGTWDSNASDKKERKRRTSLSSPCILVSMLEMQAQEEGWKKDIDLELS